MVVAQRMADMKKSLKLRKSLFPDTRQIRVMREILLCSHMSMRVPNLFGPESHNRLTNAMANWRRITGILRALLALREEYRAPNIATHVIEGV
jgi:hypothetical protein